MQNDKEYKEWYPKDANDLGLYQLGDIIKSSMFEQSITMRKLSKLTGICTSSISRIVNGKQLPAINHLQKFSRHLNIPIEELLLSIGIGSKERFNKDSYFMLNMIQDILQLHNMDISNVICDIKKELTKYEAYSKTEEGQKIILDEYISKVAKINGSGIIIEQLNSLYDLFYSEDIEPNEKTIIGGALLYFILSADIIPDYVFPIGYLDDAIAINIVVQQLPKYFNF
ncbi:DUF1232 domain-containing protein [Sedimentibacter hydroxybenzoicus DSM 7310]|uniref:DUF1232 domain-containing protein n=1 Tax=Sedimentibacter hydroxybenzoicus DSM 7310 TaxID=1123245 RepID=A0A974GVW1_SEDHY|nr:DUF1232 domain-containing protein [Sedimentibacter hydroxybenzoicus]NYB73793.1 DUF1232 domain-containing protein [Sedimentibacter hydroxybenzoicus DSM 7310]